MSDIVDRLRNLYNVWNNPPSPELPVGASLILETANEIERLRAELEAAQARLGPVLALPIECVNSLTCQRQIDAHGAEVGISRQAVDEIHDALTRARASLPPADGKGET